MRTLVWSPGFARDAKRLARRNPELRDRLEQALKRLAQDPFDPALHTHKLKGGLAGTWACTVDYDNRVIFGFSPNPQSSEEDILLLTVGTHDEVY